MGLQIKAGKSIVIYDGSYGEYGDMCARIANAAGYKTRPADGAAARARHERRVDFECLPHAQTDVLIILLGHQDDGGIIANAYCKPLAARLAAVVDRVKNPETRRSVLAMIRGLRAAAREGLDITYA